MRLFIAVELPEPVREELNQCVVKLKVSEADIRWVKTENFHVTLKFLGSVEEAKLSSVMDELEKISRRSKPFVARLSSLGGFSQVTDPQIIWAGIGEGHEAFEKLEKLIDESM